MGVMAICRRARVGFQEWVEVTIGGAAQWVNLSRCTEIRRASGRYEDGMTAITGDDYEFIVSETPLQILGKTEEYLTKCRQDDEQYLERVERDG